MTVVVAAARYVLYAVKIEFDASRPPTAVPWDNGRYLAG